MIKVSATALKRHAVCRRIPYIKKVMRYDGVETASRLLGSFVHRAIDSLEKNGPEDMTSLHKRFLEEIDACEKISFGRGQTIPYLLDRLSGCMANYNIIRDELPPLIGTEVRFDIPYSEEVKLVGIYDQVREGDVIVELKTARAAPSMLFLEAEVQPSFYIHTYHLMHGVTPTFLYVSLTSGVVYELTRSNLNELEHNIAEYVDDFRTSNFLRQPDGYKCKECYYKDVCFEGIKGSRVVFAAMHNAGQNKIRRPSRFFQN